MEELRKQLVARDALLAEQDKRIAQLLADNAVLRQRLEQLERQIGLNSSNSGKPPSSDGPGKPSAEQRTRSTRGRSGKRSGGQPGHRGATLQRTETPDRVQDHLPTRCDGCGAVLSAADTVGTPVARQVFDLPEPQPLEVTEHWGWACLPVPCLWPHDTGGLPGRGEGTGAVRAAHRRHGGLLADCAVPAEGPAGGSDEGSVRRAAVRGDAGEHDGQGGAAVAGLRRERARPACVFRRT